ncbi:MAG TPA: peptide-methionine (S)-S-oxide reductase MsrA [Abditibacteriaceae bacterium]|nr:peptide-methionine (S)-S-oxide reductase MsrA [Abditibacteriaceae bacterium]
MTHLNQSRKPLFYAVLGVALIGGLTQTILTITTARTAPAQKSKAAPRTELKAPAGKEMATFAAGCFWSIEAMFAQLKGVEKAEPGYAGGTVGKPTYEQVCAGRTGHAETVNITFDPQVISYDELLHVLLTVHDPTTLNRQGADVGTQYRSAIFYHNDAQKKAAQKVIQEVTAARLWKDPIVTEVTPFTNYYRAEDYHVNYYNLHPDAPYCRNVIAPKITKFQEKFKAKLKS